jgi:hypothetical protein
VQPSTLFRANNVAKSTSSASLPGATAVSPGPSKPIDLKRYKEDVFVQQHLKELNEADKSIKLKKIEFKKQVLQKDEKLLEKQRVCFHMVE